jgi:hypothetical protein
LKFREISDVELLGMKFEIAGSQFVAKVLKIQREFDRN